MKKIVLIVTAASVFVACKNNSNQGYDSDKYVLVEKSSVVMEETLPSKIMKEAAYTGVRTLDANNVAPLSSSTIENSRTTSNAMYPVENTSASTVATTTTTTTSASTVPKRDKGWSSAAKGTVIGAGGGALLGAVVSKNKGKGAIVGALLGGGAGYLFGRHKDKKSGRVARHRARKAAGY